MEDWSKPISEILSGLYQEAERVVEDITATIDACAKITETLTQQIQDDMTRDEVNLFSTLEDLAEQLLQPIDTLVESFARAVTTESSWDDFWELGGGASIYGDFYDVQPMLEYPRACQGCQHFHGQVYRGNNALVCAMHPYGPQGETCLDWEAV
jgi:hypothetical protein